MDRKKVVLLTMGEDYPRQETVVIVSPSMGILALGSYLVAHDIPVELIDVQMDFGFGLTDETEHIICQRVVRYLHDQAEVIAWIGISQLTNTKGSFTLAQEIHAALPETPIIFGGFFPSCNYQFLLKEYPFITAVVRGDGEAAALQISRDLSAGRPFLSEHTPNLAWIDGGEIRTTPIQPAVLDDLPILDFRLIPNASYYPHITMMTSRGCPFDCNYCFESSMRPYAAYPMEWVARQLANIAEAGLLNRFLYIFDSLFGVGHQRTLEMCEIMREYDFIYYFESRVDVLTPDLMPPLAEAGVEMVFWGFDSASPATLMRMNKVRSEVQTRSYVKSALEILKACFENNITPVLGLMLGFPGDTEADLRATVNFVKEANQLYSQVEAQNGAEGGFLPSPQLTRIDQGTALAECMEHDFPEVIFDLDPLGEGTVSSPSPGVSPEMLQRCLAEIKSLRIITPKTLDRKEYAFSAKDFIASHPELTDEQGVTIFSESIRSLA